jgi:hypothetical protein
MNQDIAYIIASALCLLITFWCWMSYRTFDNKGYIVFAGISLTSSLAFLLLSLHALPWLG